MEQEELFARLERLAPMLDTVQHVVSLPLDERLLEAYSELWMVAPQYEVSPFAAIKEAWYRAGRLFVVDDLVYSGYFDHEFGVAELDVYLAYADAFRALVGRAGRLFGEYYQGFAIQAHDSFRWCGDDALAFFADKDLVRRAHLLALPEERYVDFRRSLWGVQTALAEQDFLYFPHHLGVPYAREFLDNFLHPDGWWAKLQEPLSLLKDTYDVQTFVDVASRYIVSPSSAGPGSR